MPQLIRLPSFKREVEYLVEQAKQIHERGVCWNEMAIAYRTRFIAEQVYQQFQQASVPVEWVNRDSNSRFYKPGENSIKLLTMHASKGLEFPVVLIPGIGYLPDQRNRVEEEARLLYVAMTRAIDQLVMTYHQPSEVVKRVERALGNVG
jgi:superfamily I DNA/RNA helicase